MELSLCKYDNTALAVKIIFKIMLKGLPREQLAIPLPTSKTNYTLSLLADVNLNLFLDHRVTIGGVSVSDENHTNLCQWLLLVLTSKEVSNTWNEFFLLQFKLVTSYGESYSPKHEEQITIFLCSAVSSIL